MRQTAVSLTVEDSDRQKQRQTEKTNERGEEGERQAWQRSQAGWGQTTKTKQKRRPGRQCPSVMWTRHTLTLLCCSNWARLRYSLSALSAQSPDFGQQTNANAPR